MKLLTLILALVSISVFADEEDFTNYPYPFDVEFRAAKLQLENDESEACKDLSFAKQGGCMSEIRNKVRQSGSLRGTSQYVEKHYVPLETEALESLFKVLRDDLKKARAYPPRNKDTYGELSQDDINTELRYIEDELARRQDKRRKDEMDALRNQPNK